MDDCSPPRQLERSIGQVRRGREKLRGLTPAQEEFGPAEQEEGSLLFDGEEEPR